MDFCARNELDSELAALLTKLYLAIDAVHKTKALAALPFSDIDNDEFNQLFEKTPHYGFTEAEFENAVDWFNRDFFNKFQFPAPPSDPLDYPDYDYDNLSDLD